jgi:hypothetical protein
VNERSIPFPFPRENRIIFGCKNVSSQRRLRDNENHIKYTGVEDIRFAPGWGKVNTSEYWSYAFLWYLDGRVETNVKIIESNLKAYYTGLIASNIEPRKIPAEKLIEVNTHFKKVETDKGDMETFRGTIYMLDYMEQKPIMLNCIVHLKTCKEQNKTYLFHEISPKPFDEAVWESLNQLWLDFTCDKTANAK